MLLGTAKLGGIVFSKHLHHPAQNAIPKAPLPNKCAGEETNATAINPVGNPVDGDGCLLLHLPPLGDGVRHEDLLAPKFDEDVLIQNITATSVLLAAAPTVGASSPNNIKDDAAGMPAGLRCTRTINSHNGQRRSNHSLELRAGRSAHGAVLAPLVEGGACTTFPVKIGGGGGHGVRLWCGCGVWLFVLCRAKSQM
jgi:hypothetical protein